MVTIYTSFVDESYQRISLRNFFSVHTLSVIKEQIIYRNDSFISCSEAQNISSEEQEVSPWSVAVNCDKTCNFKMYNAESNFYSLMSVVTEASEKDDTDARDIKILHADIPRGWILFSVGSYNKAYVVVFNKKMYPEENITPYLKHEIQLEPFAGNIIEYIGITTDRLGGQYAVFLSRNRSEIYVYSIQNSFLLKYRIKEGFHFGVSRPIFSGGCFQLFDESGKEFLFDFEE